MRILLCSEGTERSESAIQLCLKIASATQAEVTIFGVTELAPDEVPLLEAIRRTQHAFMAQGVNVEILSKYGEPISEIEKRAVEGNYDLIVIGGEAKPGGQISVLSQKAYEIIEMLVRPVWWVPPPPTKAPPPPPPPWPPPPPPRASAPTAANARAPTMRSPVSVR